MADAPLSQLCSICYTDPPKYRCPRCPGPVRTCSLPCYKRHQQRASCNGQRDPTAYVKKSLLATPAGIDHDYNFLTGIERVVGDIDKEAGERGICGQETKISSRRWNEHGSLQRYLRDNRILVDRAPLGMSRQKANQTRFLQKSKKIVWTVEWVDGDGAHSLCEVDEGTKLADFYASMLAAREKRSKKRKRPSHGENDVVLPALESPAPDDVVDGMTKPTLSLPPQHMHQSPGNGGTRDDRDPPLDLPSLPANASGEEPTATGSGDTAMDQRSLILQRMQLERARQDALKQESGLYFYLLKPHTTSASRILIPLKGHQSLTSSLHGQVVLEYPTIYVLAQPAHALPSAFATEQAYLEVKKQEDSELDSIMDADPRLKRAVLQGGISGSGDDAQDVAGGGGGGGGGGAEAQWDSRKILDMLKRDIPA